MGVGRVHLEIVLSNEFSSVGNEAVEPKQIERSPECTDGDRFAVAPYRRLCCGPIPLNEYILCHRTILLRKEMDASAYTTKLRKQAAGDAIARSRGFLSVAPTLMNQRARHKLKSPSARKTRVPKKVR